MKPTKNFRLSKRSKTMVALLGFKDQETRNAFRAGMVQAQLASDIKMKAEPRKSFTSGQAASRA